MSRAERYIIDSYTALFERLSSMSKIELLDRLVKSIKKDTKSHEIDFFRSFGAFGSDKPAEIIAKEIRESRAFVKNDLKL